MQRCYLYLLPIGDKKMLRFILKVANTSFKKETKGLLTQTPVRHTPCLRCIWMETSTMADWEVTSNAAVDCVSLAPYVNAAASQSWSLPSVNLTVIWSLCHTVKGSSWPLWAARASLEPLCFAEQKNKLSLRTINFAFVFWILSICGNDSLKSNLFLNLQ